MSASAQVVSMCLLAVVQMAACECSTCEAWSTAPSSTSHRRSRLGRATKVCMPLFDVAPANSDRFPRGSHVTH